jgi:WD40 repeat protein
MFLPASSTVMPSGTFATCSADNSIRFWNTNREGQKKSNWKSAYSKDLLHTIHLDVPASCSGVSLDVTSAVRSTGESIIYSQSLQDAKSSFDLLSSGMPDTEIPDRPVGSQAPRVLAAHPNGSCFAVGDRAGRIRTFDMTCMTLVQSINAHDAEVLTLQYSPAPSTTERDMSSTVLLASAGRDRYFVLPLYLTLLIICFSFLITSNIF